MKIKMFHDDKYTHESITKTEKEVNEFMKNKNVIDVELMSEGAENGHSYTIVVLYNE